MDKLKKYNQWTLAILTTLGILLLVGVCLFSLIEIFDVFRPRAPLQNRILAEEQTQELINKNQRKQVVSFSRMELIDTLNSIHLIPVGQENLNKVEDLSNVRNTKAWSNKRYYSGFGIYNNLLTYDENSGLSKEIFDDRVAISSYEVIYNKEEVFLFIKAATADTNKDRFKDGSDIQHLYIYDVNTESLTAVESENMTFLNIDHLHSGNNHIAYYGIDTNMDGKYNAVSEPKRLYKIDINNGNKTSVISNDKIEKLQKRLEGRE